VTQTIDAALRDVRAGEHAGTRTVFPFSYAASGFLVASIEFIVIVATAVACGVSYNMIAYSLPGDAHAYLGVGGLFGVLYLLRMHALGAYAPETLIERSGFASIASAWIFSFSVLTIAAYLLKIGHVFSRGSLVSFLTVGFVVIVVQRFAFRAMLRWARAQHLFNERRVLLIGEPSELADRRLVDRLRRSGYGLQDVVSLDLRSPDQVAKSVLDAVTRARSSPIQEVLLCVSWSNLDDADEILERLRVLPVPVFLIADRRVRAFLPSGLSSIGLFPAIEVQRAPLSTLEQATKRTLDFAGATLGLIALSPIFALAAIAIKLDTPGSILFRQTRTGFGGRPFTIYKFRTMTVAQDGAVVPQAQRNDARVTRVGRILRRTSIDELPQLFNVIKGDMSLVGPRPHALAHDNEYTRIIMNYSFRHHMKPGITGWAQVSGFRGETPTVDRMEQRLERDLWYINNWTIWLDIKLVLLTPVRIISQDDPY
jgi:putative colanic acid biosynthesis UDP-glucose lipid carrier transferase